MGSRGGTAPEVIVVGAGLVGAALSYRLARAGAQVTVLDGGDPGRGTSATSFAWVNASDKPPLAYHRLNAAGVVAHRRLRDDVLGAPGAPPAPWLHEQGGLQLTDAAGHEALQQKVARLQSWGYGVDMLDVADAAAIEPHLRWDGITGAAFAPDEAWVDGPRCVAAVLGAAVAHGATVRPRTPVTGFVRAGDAVAGVTLGGGQPLAAGAVVIAAGRWSDALGRLAGVDVPLAPSCGLLAVTSPVAAGVSRVVHVPGMNFRPDPGGAPGEAGIQTGWPAGGYVMQSGETDGTVTADTPPAPDLPGCATLLEGVARYLPALAGARIVAARVGVRPMPADGLTLAGPVPERPGLFLVVTHSGVTLAPLLGELVAAEVLTGVAPDILDPFRPRRLVRPLAQAPQVAAG